MPHVVALHKPTFSLNPKFVMQEWRSNPMACNPLKVVIAHAPTHIRWHVVSNPFYNHNKVLKKHVVAPPCGIQVKARAPRDWLEL